MMVADGNNNGNINYKGKYMIIPLKYLFWNIIIFIIILSYKSFLLCYAMEGLHHMREEIAKIAMTANQLIAEVHQAKLSVNSTNT